ncbi:MAG: PKD domain-containing protein, partial [Proteobacteria bacterium]
LLPCYSQTFSYSIEGNVVIFESLVKQVVTNYVWSFGDLNVTKTSSSKITHLYNQQNTYLVSHSAFDKNNRLLATETKLVTSPANLLPTNTFRVINVTNATVFLDATSSIDGDGSIVQYIWNMDTLNILNVNRLSSEDQFQTYTYPLPKSQSQKYRISLQTKDNSGSLSPTLFYQDIIIYPTPKADFQTEIRGNAVVFSIKDYYQSLVNYTWVWDDESFTEPRNVTNLTTFHYFPTKGKYTVKLVVQDLNSQTASISRVVDAPKNILPSPNISIESQSNNILRFKINDSKDEDGSIIMWNIDFGDNSNVTMFRDSSISHFYKLGGWYTVTLTTTDNSKAKNSTSLKIFLAALIRF